ncbi:MAG: acyltransferase family protein, partial [Bacteroidales bacterium]|nr:acyltransferase family protein [Bacteroidales bacterium]
VNYIEKWLSPIEGVDMFIGVSAKICLGIFLFCSGYGLYKSYLSKENPGRFYTLKKIVQTLIPYWLIMLVAIAVLVYLKKFNPKYIFVSLFALIHDDEMLYVSFSWYIKLYILLMLILPLIRLIERKWKKNIIIDLLLYIALPFAVYYVFKGYMDEVEMGDFNWDTFTFDFDYSFIVNSVEEVNFVKKDNWSVRYDGRSDEHPGYPEAFYATVTGGDTERYAYTIFTDEKLKEFPVETEAGVYGAIMAADDIQYGLSAYALGHSKEEIYEAFTYVGSTPNFYSKFEPGIYYVAIGGVDADGYATGSYAISQFEIEDPHVAGTYDAFLGTWKYTTALGDSQKWVISEKEAGESYYLCIDGVSTESGNLPVLSYDKENGTAVLEMQELGEYEKDGKTYLERVGTLYTFDDVEYYDNSRYMGDNTLVFTARMLNDGTVDIVPGEDTSSPLEGFAIMTGDKEDSYDCNIVGSISAMPGVLGEYKGSAAPRKTVIAKGGRDSRKAASKIKSDKKMSFYNFR